MRKNTIHDIIPPQRDKRPRPQPPAMENSEYRDPTPPLSRPPVRRSGRRLSSWVIMAVIAVAVVSLLVVAFSFLFAGAQVTVVPREESATVDGSFTAYPEADAAAGELIYQSMSIDRTVAQTVTASGQEHAEERASGRIMVYNNYSTEDQRLIKNTRFETPEGLIYRIDDSIVVPGQTENTEGELVAGSIEVTVYADSPGEEYNVGLTDFTVPGFEGSPQYEHFYARSKTPMTGGFVGTRPAVDSDMLEQVKESLEGQVRQQLEIDAVSQKPADFVLFPGAMFVTYEYLPLQSRGAQDVEVSVRGTLHGILFPEIALGSLLAERTVPNYSGEPVRLTNPNDLQFSIPPVQEGGAIERPWEAGELVFTLQGNAHLIWEFNRDSLAQDLLGRQKDAVTTILSGYPGVKRAEVVIRPFWKDQLPENAEDITIQVETESP